MDDGIDVLGWLQKRLTKPTMISGADALPGREQSVLNPMPKHLQFALPLDEVPAGAEVAYFAFGCYWGAERIFWEQDGVVNTAVGFAGGFTPNPTYEEVCTGKTGHTETVRVVFDPSKISYPELLKVFWEHHDPTQGFRQGNDIGTQYRSAIFPINDDQLQLARRSLSNFQEPISEAGLGEISTEIKPDQQFYFAEDAHQQYLIKNPSGYDCHVRTGIACPLP